MEPFKTRLSKIMKEKGLNQLDISAIVGVRQSQVSNWLSGRSLPGYKSICALCKSLKVEPNYLLDLK
ncbi:MAG: helix-turn-helix domain-containing protein [Firmicutes bacterium]|nr:helix-turn-helix domain-containing protein [Bacillota bacterium]